MALFLLILVSASGRELHSHLSSNIDSVCVDNGAHLDNQAKSNSLVSTKAPEVTSWRGEGIIFRLWKKGVILTVFELFFPCFWQCSVRREKFEFTAVFEIIRFLGP